MIVLVNTNQFVPPIKKHVPRLSNIQHRLIIASIPFEINILISFLSHLSPVPRAGVLATMRRFVGLYFAKCLGLYIAELSPQAASRL